MKLMYKVLIVFFLVMFSVIIFLTNRYVNNAKNIEQTQAVIETADVNESSNETGSSIASDTDECMYVEIKKVKKNILNDFDKSKKKTSSVNTVEDDDEVEILETTEEDKTENKKLGILDAKAKELAEKNIQAIEKSKQNAISSENKEQAKNEEKNNNEENNNNETSQNNQQVDNTTQNENNNNQEKQNESQESDNSEKTTDNVQGNVNTENQQQEENEPNQRQDDNSGLTEGDSENQEN